MRDIDLRLRLRADSEEEDVDVSYEIDALGLKTPNVKLHSVAVQTKGGAWVEIDPDRELSDEARREIGKRCVADHERLCERQADRRAERYAEQRRG